MISMKIPLAFAISFLIYVAVQAQSRPELILRMDDVGMNHAINMAVEDVCKTGIPFSASVMFACPWYQEAVDILKKYPHVNVGIHLTLTSEWRYYRWGPVTGASAVPSMVDSLGYFFKNEDEFLKHNVSIGEVEKELMGQIERALASGLKISYMDPHMGVVFLTPELTALTEKLARKYNLGLSTLGQNVYYNEAFKDMWAVPVEQKKREFLKHLDQLKADRPNVIMLHIAHRDPEMDVLEMPGFLERQKGIPMAGKHRQAELDMLLSPEFKKKVDERKFTFITYGQLITRSGK